MLNQSDLGLETLKCAKTCAQGKIERIGLHKQEHRWDYKNSSTCALDKQSSRNSYLYEENLSFLKPCSRRTSASTPAVTSASIRWSWNGVPEWYRIRILCQINNIKSKMKSELMGAEEIKQKWILPKELRGTCIHPLSVRPSVFLSALRLEQPRQEMLPTCRCNLCLWPATKSVCADPLVFKSFWHNSDSLVKKRFYKGPAMSTETSFGMKFLRSVTP